MRIGIDVRLINQTGVGRYIRNLINELLVLDTKNEYVLFMGSRDYLNIKYQISNIKNKNYQIVKADIGWHTLQEQLQMPGILAKENLDLMHFPYHSVTILYNKPFVVTIHDLIPYHFSTGEATTLPLPVYKLKQLGYKFVIKKAAQKARKIIAVSNATKKEIIDHLHVPENKVEVIYEGVISQKSKVKSQKFEYPYFLYVGNAYPHKNLEGLIKAFNQLKKENIKESSELKLVLVGRQDFFYRRLKQKLSEKELANIKFLGFVEDDKLINLYENALALVAPSFMEGFGLTPLEAMASSCLVLASDIPVHREICKDFAIYFDPYDINDLKTKMSSIIRLENSKRQEYLKSGLSRSSFFSWEKMARETLNIYENCSSTISE